MDDDLVLLDAKRFGLPSAVLMGGAGLSERMTADIGHATEQFFETASDIEQHGMAAVVPEFAGWTPKRVFAAAISHRPMYAWFGAPDQISRAADLPRPWETLFAARPVVWSIAELELIEAALPTVPLRQVLDALAMDHVTMLLDLHVYLEEIRWRGLVASEYYAKRARALLHEHKAPQ